MTGEFYSTAVKRFSCRGAGRSIVIHSDQGIGGSGRDQLLSCLKSGNDAVSSVDCVLSRVGHLVDAPGPIRLESF